MTAQAQAAVTVTGTHWQVVATRAAGKPFQFKLPTRSSVQVPCPGEACKLLSSQSDGRSRCLLVGLGPRDRATVTVTWTPSRTGVFCESDKSELRPH